MFPDRNGEPFYTSDELDKIQKSLEQDEVLPRINQKGNCRIWSNRAMGVLEERGFATEAREAEVNGVDHTFLEVQGRDGKYIVDGVGVGPYEPYLGEDTPDHLKNSRSDVINKLRDLTRRR